MAADAALVQLASGKQLHVQERGSRTGPAVLFLHGLGSRSEFWGARGERRASLTTQARPSML